VSDDLQRLRVENAVLRSRLAQLSSNLDALARLLQHVNTIAPHAVRAAESAREFGIPMEKDE
jgi:hypothetical protein